MINQNNNSYQINQLDAIDWLKSLPNESVDLIITDVAYESLEKHRKTGTTTRLKKSKSSSNNWFPIFPNNRFDDFFKESYRVLKKNSHLYFFCDNETMFYSKPIGEQNGFKFWNNIIFDKVHYSMGYHYRRRYENILFFEKGKRKLNSFSIPDVLQFKRIKTKNSYPTEKPVDLFEVLIKQSSQTGEIVCDPFMGSGNCGVAAVKNNRIFWGNDISNSAYIIAETKLNKELNK